MIDVTRGVEWENKSRSKLVFYGVCVVVCMRCMNKRHKVDDTKIPKRRMQFIQ